MTSGARCTCHLALLCGALAVAAPTAAVPAVSDALGMGPALTQWFAAAYQLTSGPLQALACSPPACSRAQAAPPSRPSACRSCSA